MTIAFIVLILAAILNVGICLVVLYRNSKKAANISFALTSLSLTCWAVFNFLSTYVPISSTLITTRFTGLFGAFLITNFYVLSTVFPANLPPRKWLKYMLVFVGFFVVVLCLTPLFITSAVNAPTGLKLTVGVLYPLYPLYAAVLFILCNVNFIRQYKHAEKYARYQIQLMWTGIFITVAFIMLSNIIMPAMTKDWSSSTVGTIFTLPFVGLTAYAIIKRRMFDLRSVISRTIAYITTIGIVAALYTLAVLLITTHFTSVGLLTGQQISILIIPTLFVALTFHRLQVFINEVTKKVFYRDAYELRDVLDQLSDALLVRKDIASLMAKSLHVFIEAIKPSTARFIVLDESGAVDQYGSFGTKKSLDVPAYIVQMSRQRKSLVESDDQNNTQLKALMTGDEVDLILRLGSKEKPVGFLLFGTKRNGGMYTDQDISLLTIGAKNLVLALDDAEKYEEILKFADTLHAEVTRATSRLRKANTELKTLDSLKDDFIATASHQLRTPAASVHDALRMLNEPFISTKDRKELTSLAEASSEHLVTVVRTMLNMARLQAGHFTIDKSEAELTTLTQKVVDQALVLAKQKHSNIVCTYPKNPLNTTIDVAKISEALANYIENAVKYSPDHSTITVNVSEENGFAIFEVGDEGMGVPVQERGALFGKFYRASNARLEQPDGNGIGLYVVKNIAEGHGGEAFYRPGNEKGSIFGFRIPVHHSSTPK